MNMKMPYSSLNLAEEHVAETLDHSRVILNLSARLDGAGTLSHPAHTVAGPELHVRTVAKPRDLAAASRGGDDERGVSRMTSWPDTNESRWRWR